MPYHKNLVKILSIVFVIFLVLFGGLFLLGQNLNWNIQEGVSVNGVSNGDIEVLYQNLRVPWDIAFIDNEEILITQRNGILVRANADLNYINIDEVISVGESGLHGIALHPEFESNRYLYLYMSVREEDLINRVVRYRYENGTLNDRQIIIDNIPAASIHNGGMIRFGPDNYLYITTGDAGVGENAQSLESLAGKILRINDDGSIPENNPFDNSPVYSYGHRNSQGLAWDNENNLWSTEHGRSGNLSGYDEINRIEAGGNYGWPVIQGSETREGMISPVLHSGPTTTWAPGAVVFYEGNLFFSGLRGQSLYQYNVSENTLIRHFNQEYGRIRSVVLGPDNNIYMSTSNLDGRGSPMSGDDRIIKVNPQILLD
jgi:aldose sugar dehydrogenase